MSSLSDTLSAIRPAACGFAVEPGVNWYQGRTLYGGLLAAMSVEAARSFMPGLPPLRSAQFTFSGPSSGVVELVPTLLRAGRSVTSIGVDVLSGGSVAMRAALTFASDRPSRHRFGDLPAPRVPPPSGGASLFDAPGTPRSAGNFEGRLAGGHAPFSGADRPELTVWLRHRGPAPVSGEGALLALADASPPAVFPIFAGPAPISTVSLSIDFTGTAADPGDWLLAHTRSAHVSDGYSLQATTMWTQQGAAVLEARQLVALYD